MSDLPLAKRLIETCTVCERARKLADDLNEELREHEFVSVKAKVEIVCTECGVTGRRLTDEGRELLELLKPHLKNQPF